MARLPVEFHYDSKVIATYNDIDIPRVNDCIRIPHDSALIVVRVSDVRHDFFDSKIKIYLGAY